MNNSRIFEKDSDISVSKSVAIRMSDVIFLNNERDENVSISKSVRNALEIYRYKMQDKDFRAAVRSNDPDVSLIKFI